MRATAAADVRGEPARVVAVLADLGTWPRWLDVVLQATPEPGTVAAWRARLGLRVGPVALGYDVRLVRTVADPAHLRFERRELDGAEHSPVVLDVRLAPAGDAVHVRLDAEIAKRIPLLDLQRELDRRGPGAVAKLEALVAEPSFP